MDIARFLAFCGMVLVNFRVAAGVAEDASAASALISMLEGRAAALFVVLAGTGLAQAAPARSTLAVRALVLMMLGLLNLAIFEADILHFYAVYFLCALPLLDAPRPVLLWAAAGAVLVSLAGFVFLDYEAHWDWESLTCTGFWTLKGFLRNTFLNGWHPVFPWVAFLFSGMWIGRLDLGKRRVQTGLAAGGALVAVLGALPALWVQDPELAGLAGTAPVPPGPSCILSASGSAAAATGLLLRVAPRLPQGLGNWLAAPGRQALTHYAAHILLGMGGWRPPGCWTGASPTAKCWAWGSGSAR